MNVKPLVILAAGGTGGHLFPAQALAEVLLKRGYAVHLMTDERVRDYGKNFPASEVHLIPSASPSMSKPHLMPGAAFRLWRGMSKAKGVMRQHKPIAVVGFGGYPSFPPLFAARSLRIPTAVHEQNAVLGRANKVLATRTDAVATSFEHVTGLPRKAKVVFTGNPVRAIALAKQATPFPQPLPGGPFSLVVFGGSQGARFFSEFMPEVFTQMPQGLRRRLRLTQQCRAEDIGLVRATYQRLEVTAELNTFFANMPSLIAGAMLVVCRSGASSIAELGVIGRPAALVPLPHAIDNDQQKNAESFAKSGAGWVFPQPDLKAAEFATFLARLMNNGAELKEAAAQALRQGKPDAAERLADLVERIAARKSPAGESVT